MERLRRQSWGVCKMQMHIFTYSQTQLVTNMEPRVSWRMIRCFHKLKKVIFMCPPIGPLLLFLIRGRCKAPSFFQAGLKNTLSQTRSKLMEFGNRPVHIMEQTQQWKHLWCNNFQRCNKSLKNNNVSNLRKKQKQRQQSLEPLKKILIASQLIRTFCS